MPKYRCHVVAEVSMYYCATVEVESSMATVDVLKEQARSQLPDLPDGLAWRISRFDVEQVSG